MNIVIVEDEIMTAEDLAEIIGQLDNLFGRIRKHDFHP